MKILTIKPTERCNFKCTFCASTHIADDHRDTVKLEDVFAVIERFPELQEIHVNGGEPLLMPPDYYWAILNKLDALGRPNVELRITSNLWGFYKNPDKWTPLFKHPAVKVTTSFQYGNGRLKGDLTPFSEAEFRAISDLMLERVGYRPNFNTVITYENEDTCLDTVKLARDLGVQAKINYADSSGPHRYFKGVRIGNKGNGYPMARMYARYIEIYEAGYAQEDDSTLTMARALRKQYEACPHDQNCDAHQRVLQPNGYYSCVSFGDDKTYPITLHKELQGALQRPLKLPMNQRIMTADCPGCVLYKVCNGCHKTVETYKHELNAQEHCRDMRALMPKIIEINRLEAKKDNAELIDLIA